MEVLGIVGFLPDSQVGPGYGVVAGGIQRDAVGAGFFIAEMQSAQISVRKVAERGMLEHVVAVPFQHHPVELLPPASRDGEPA